MSNPFLNDIFRLKQRAKNFYHVLTDEGCMPLWSKVEIHALPEFHLKTINSADFNHKNMANVATRNTKIFIDSEQFHKIIERITN